MPSAEELILALRTALSSGAPLIDSQAARSWQTSLQRAVSSSVTDCTDYVHGRSYCFDWTLLEPESPNWLTVVRVRISAFGPYVTHTCLQKMVADRWWAGAVRTSRNGFAAEHREALDKLRQWYAQSELRLVEQEIQAEPVPEDLRIPGVRSKTPTLFVALFGA